MIRKPVDSVNQKIDEQNANKSSQKVAGRVVTLEQGQRADRQDPQICGSTQAEAENLLSVSKRSVKSSDDVRHNGKK